MNEHKNRKVVKIQITSVIIDEKERVRKISGEDVSDLIESMQEIGLLHPIIVNEKHRIIAGYRRLKAAKDLGWTEIDAFIEKDLTALEELDIEIQENWKRANLSPYELDFALARRKKLWELFYPETKWGATLRQGKKKIRSKSELSQVGDPARRSSIKQEPISRFTKETADEYGISERKVQDSVRVGEIITNKRLDPNAIEKYKKGEMSRTQIIELDKERRKKEKCVPDENETILYCKNCEKVHVRPCPWCGEQIVACSKDPILVKKGDARACQEYKF